MPEITTPLANTLATNFATPRRAAQPAAPNHHRRAQPSLAA